MRGHAVGSGMRYREDVGFEARCPDCARRGVQAYWPLTLEFWDPSRPTVGGGTTGRSLTRCRACWRLKDARARRRRYRDHESLRLREQRRNAAYRAECREAIRIQQRATRAAA